MKRTPSIIILSIVAVLSVTVIYPVVHEGGHFLSGRLQGIEARDAVWTVWGGRPHVSFGATPAHAIAWINAGGIDLAHSGGCPSDGHLVRCIAACILCDVCRALDSRTGSTIGQSRSNCGVSFLEPQSHASVSSPFWPVRRSSIHLSGVASLALGIAVCVLLSSSEEHVSQEDCPT